MTDIPTPAAHEPTPASDQAATEIAVHARDLQLDGKRGRIYGPLDLSLARGSLTVITGRAGTGKSSLLLTLAGRMKPTSGELTVVGYQLPRQERAVQRRTSAMGIAGLDDLDDEVTVGACVRERQAWLAKPWKIVRTPGDGDVARVCRPTFGDLPVPRSRDIVHGLPEATNLLLRIALALLSDPELIVVDEIDQIHDLAERDLVWRRLEALAADGLTVVAACAGAAEVDRVSWTTRPRHVELPEHEIAVLAPATSQP